MNGYSIIETFWKMGNGQAEVATYKYDQDNYKKISFYNINNQQIEKYFSEKKLHHK